MSTQTTHMVSVVLDGQPIRLEMRIYQPASTGIFPTLVFNHGSTGAGTDPYRFTQPIDEPPLAQFFVQRGWAVILPARRGRGNSEGVYDEGFDQERTLGYTCDPPRSLAGAERALADIAAAMDAIRAFPFVDPQRLVIGGQSRGGILSVAYAGLYPDHACGVINFVGGWLGVGCPTASQINQTLFRRGVPYGRETLWLYGDGDPFYPLSHSQANFAAFLAAGGKGSLHILQPPEANGHHLVEYPEVWNPTVLTYLQRVGMAINLT
jgi:dienelactone hydrolase